MSWHLKPFQELSNHELYSILQIRNAVFIVEQACYYQDVDNKDLNALHLFYIKDNAMLAYCRILPAGISYKEASIGRFLTVQSARNQGLGKVLIEQAIYHIKERWPKTSIRISAQQYLEAFYQSFGFKTQGDMYLEDDIPHIEMLLDLNMPTL
ncbi:MAG: GNAT family N-acetyltransferase [Bacteroidetes bacterium 43-16]|nr:MAG: GNAT family N-acetyltransferase [Bacteroidetes bacterium 43-16]